MTAEDSELRRASRDAALLEDTAEELYENAPCGYLSSVADGTVARVNQTFLAWTGYESSEVLGRRFVDLLTPGGRIYHETHFAPLLALQGSVQSIALDIVRADGSRMPALINARVRTDDSGRVLAVRTTVFDATDRNEYERELLAARRRAEENAGRLEVLEGVVADLAAVARVSDVSEVIVRAGVEAFGAAISVMWLLEPVTGTYRWAGAAPVTLAEHAMNVPGEASVPRSSELRSGRVVVLDPAEKSRAVEIVASTAGADGSLLLTPLAAHNRSLGILALRFHDERVLEPAEHALLSTLGRQAGQAVERAALFDEQRSVAQTLQHSMFPRDVPNDPRLLIGAVYRPADDGLEVGGDWYDAFYLDADRLALVMGDVVGRGLHAAAAMGQLRSAVRALAVTDSGPAVLLNRLDGFVAGVEAADIATIVYAELDLRDGHLRYACAGHPPPVLVLPDRTPEPLWGGRSPPLGAHFGAAPRGEAEANLTPRSRLVLYTDGLVERRNTSLDDRIAELAGELDRRRRVLFPALVERLTHAMVGTGPTGDDVCVLALERTAELRRD